MPGMNYRQSKAELHPQDIMVLYTDGISESVNSKGEQFGVERLRMAIEKSAHQSSKEVLDRIMSDLSEFTHGQEQFDDITAIVLRMN
jgi:sigma-B regulation protein RsbU (phosphoserine phosphatase)